MFFYSPSLSLLFSLMPSTPSFSPLVPSIFYHRPREPAHIPSPPCRGLKQHRWSLLTCYSSLCQKLCQNNAGRQQARGFYLFPLRRPVNFTDVSLVLNHQLISFVLIKRLILNMSSAANERCSRARRCCSCRGAAGA